MALDARTIPRFPTYDTQARSRNTHAHHTGSYRFTSSYTDVTAHVDLKSYHRRKGSPGVCDDVSVLCCPVVQKIYSHLCVQWLLVIGAGAELPGRLEHCVLSAYACALPILAALGRISTHTVCRGQYLGKTAVCLSVSVFVGDLGFLQGDRRGPWHIVSSPFTLLSIVESPTSTFRRQRKAYEFRRMKNPWTCARTLKWTSATKPAKFLQQ